MRLCAVFGCLLLVCANCALAAPSVLYSHPAYESPVRGDPGDLLLLAGYGFAPDDTVVYQAIGDTTQPLAPPGEIPTTSTATAGIAPVVSVLNVPDSLTVRLPTAMQADASYALWVRNTSGEWSNGVKINDARPLWITPDTVYSTAPIAGLPRYLKVVGRNLHPAPGSVTEVKLLGPSNFTLTAANDNNPATAIEHYVGKVDLPANLPQGSYAIEISRDGVSWISLEGQTLTVFPDPPPVTVFDVSAYGGCMADDNVDDTSCIAAAIAAAKDKGGGTVAFGPGVWDMNYTGAPNPTGPLTYDGVLLPVGVNLAGAKTGTTVLQRDTGWGASTPNFALQGNNTVQGITFRDANVYQASSAGVTMLRLGVNWYRAHYYSPGDPGDVSGVTLTGNKFDKPFIAISGGGLPIDHLLVTYNEFGAFSNPVAINGDGNNMSQPFHIDDSVFAFNTFKPGSYDNPSTGQGALATGLGAGHHLDFSGNTADGTSTDYLYDAANDAKGWRAGYFWTNRGNQDEVLVSQNVATCTGDKAGDGEAITTDGGSFTVGLAAMQPILAATTNTVTIPGPLLLQQAGKTLPGNYFYEHWVQIAAGPGKGQVRRIVSYPLDASGQPVSPVTFTVSPAWDVSPHSDSMLVVSREDWQFYMVDNLVDQRQPLCTKGNANRPAGGKIQFYAQTADSVIEGNRLYDTSGINLGVGYEVADSQYNTAAATNLFSFVDIRANTVDGEYDWASDCSSGGISVTDGASPTAGFPPPVEGYAISVSHNTITHADGLHGGAIDLTRGWYAGPAPSTWQLEGNVLVFANAINDVSGPPAQRVNGPLPYATSAYKICGRDLVPRVATHVQDATMWHTVFFANSCSNVMSNLVDGGTASRRVCPSPGGISCDCSSYAQGNYSDSFSVSAISGAYPAAQAAGDLNVVVIGWGDSTSNISGVTDSAGNVYALAIGPTRSVKNVSQSIYYAANIAAASSNTVTVTFDGTVESADIRIAEYRGIEPSNPLDVAAGAADGTGATQASAAMTTNNVNDLLVAGGLVYASGAAGGASTGMSAVPDYTPRLATDAGNMLEDRIVSAAGPYQVDAASAQSTSVVQVAAFRLAGGGNTNTQALSAPGNLSATASGAQINLSWTAATDNLGVTGYLVERCPGMGCVNFTQIASVTDTSYPDIGPLTPSGSYTYRVRATDVANLRSNYSRMASATSAGP
jgi:hypothetical protein